MPEHDLAELDFLDESKDFDVWQTGAMLATLPLLDDLRGCCAPLTGGALDADAALADARR